MQVVQLRSQPREAEARSPVVMVVDDSLTVRKITTRHLQRHGLDVMVAKDGLDAMEQLREQVPDIMLVDIEMPRMDGYELTANVRSDAALRHVPIIMITSRAGTKHRDRAMQLGVNFYMSKPYQEDELMRNIHALIAEQRTPQGQTGTTGRG
jgi:chemosensory pili system protein ChpA (sensor histidine kinase/response regulator)